MTLNEHGIDIDRIAAGSVVRCLQGGNPLDGGGRVRTVHIDHREGGRLTAHTVDQLTPQGSTDLLHVNDITGIE
ncbi:hypothetical protein [Prauserella endophytica]|uniref:DUF1918 domain-containing protein n=1 Tax=Prauserella endophytica TaxID=1592324 RepID=A0ABY2RUX9_9PSEU|nr:hypothetical protein [Prauserella endophytica]TKG61524.1 hypothetical protein FCN18_33330 [Prauserella endophytica]